MDNRYNRHNRRKYSLKVHIILVTKYRKQLLNGNISDDVKQKIFDISRIICGRSIAALFSNSIGRNISSGPMVTLLVALEKYHQRLYKNT